MAVVKQISIDKLAKELELIPGELQKEVYEAVYDALLKSIKPMAKRSPVDTGLYASSWSVEKITKELIIFLNDAPYAIILEYGMRPGQKVNHNAILHWTSRKLQKPITDSEVKGMAYAVWRKLEREGRPPGKYLERGLNEIIMPEIERGLRKLKDKYA